MKPSFALNLSHDGIGLLHRGRGGWLRVGDVALDDPEMTDRMAWLRKTAASLATGGVTTKLILPNSEILYDEVPAPGSTEAEREAQVKAGLEGRTPYAVADLAYDYVVTDGVARVVVVARETLEEAEAFATEHRFNPVSFVAMPPEDAPEGWFPGEPLFGTTRASQSLLDPEDPLERENEAVRIVGHAKAAEVTSDAPMVEVSETQSASEIAAQDAAKAEAAQIAAAVAASQPDPEPAAPEPPEASEPPETAAIPSFGSRRTGAARAPLPATDGASSAPSRLGNRSTRIAFVPKSDAEKEVAAARPAPTPPTVAPAAPRKVATPVPAPRKASASTQVITQRGEPKEIPTLIDDLAPAGLAAADTLFAKPPQARKTLSLGLMITGGLLILLLVVAIIAMLFFPGADEASDTLAPEATAPIVQASVPAPEAEQDQDIDGETAAVDPVVPLAPVGPTLLEAEATYAETGIWQRAPDMPEQTDISNDQGIFLSALDAEASFGDAVALPDYLIGRDLRPVTPLPPIGPGQVFELDENGLVVVTTEGAVNPEGVRITLGRPALVPPSRPAEAGAAQIAVDEAAAAEANSALALLRPRERPGDADEIIERARFGGFTIAELEAKKPRPRPESEQALAAAEALADAGESGETEISPLAVASSRSPVLRPSNIADLVASARAAQPAPTPVAAAAIARAAPSIPTTASVARQATLQNAISLRRVSLIGVYGSASTRRALVRLSSGRIVPVEVGERLDGGRVAAIGENAIQYVKNGRNVTLRLPTGG